MKLLQLHVDNFGVLSRYDTTFRDGVNVILAENGWGKSTLAAFLRAMLYGLDPDGGTSERERYAPWQGGTFGGTLDLAAQGKKLRIARTFGKSPEADKLTVTDTATGKPAEGFEENIGETLFGLDAGAFRRSVFIGQNELHIGSGTAVQKRLDALVESAGNAGGYDAATERLQQEIQRCETALPAAAQELGEQENLLKRLQDELSGQTQSREALLQHRERLNGITAQLTEQKEQFAAYQKAVRQREARLAEIAGMEQALQALREKQNAVLEMIGGKMPDMAEISRLQTQQQTEAAFAAEQADLAETGGRLAGELAAIAQRYAGTLPDASLPEQLEQLEQERRNIQAEIDQHEAEEKNAPEGFRRIQKIEDPDFPAQLQEAVSAEETLNALQQRITETENALRQEQALWEESCKQFRLLTAETDALREKLNAQKSDSPEVIEPLIGHVEELQQRCAELTQEIDDCDKACIEAERLWGSRQERYNLMQEEVKRMTEELEAHSGYDTDEIKVAVAQISDMQKRRTRLAEDERTYKETLNVETVRWEEMHKHYDALKSEADRLSKEAEDSAAYDPEAVDEAAKLLEQVQEAEQTLAFKQTETERSALLPEETEQLRTLPEKLPDAEVCASVLQQYRMTDRLRFDLDETRSKLASTQEQLASMRQSADELGDAAETTGIVNAGAPVGMILIGIGVLLLILGILLGIFVKPVLYAAAAVGLLCVVIGIVLHIARRKHIEAAAAREFEKKKRWMQRTDLKNRIEKAETEITSLTEKEKTLTKELEDSTESVAAWCKEWLPGDDLTKLPETAERYLAQCALRDKQASFQQMQDEADALRKEIDDNLAQVYAKYPELRDKPAAEALTSLRASEAEHRVVCRQRDTVRDNLKAWLKSNGYDADTKLLDDGRSPKVVHLEEQLEAVRVAWETLAADREKLDQKYPAIRGMDGEASLLFLTRQGEAYRLAVARKRSAEKTLLAFYAETKLNADQLEQDTSPEIPILRERQEQLREELRDAAKQQDLLCADYPEAQNVPPEEAAAALQERLSRYRLLKGKMQAAAGAEERFLSASRFTREELSGDGSAQMQTLRQTIADAQAERQNLSESCTSVLQKLGIRPEPLTEGLHTAGKLLQEYQTHMQVQQAWLTRCRELTGQAEALQKQQDALLPGAAPLDERIRVLRSDLAAAADLQAQITRNSEAAAKCAEKLNAVRAEADALLAAYTGPETDRAARIAGYLARTQEAAQLAAEASAKQQQRDAAEQTLQAEPLPENGDALEKAVTDLTAAREQVLADVSREDEAIRQAERHLADFPAAQAKLRTLTDRKTAAEERLGLLRRTAEGLAQAKAALGGRYRSRLQACFDGYLERFPAKLKSTVTDELGIQTGSHPADCYSTGEQAVLDLCMRFALADTLFADEQPFLILDDPFADLDEKQLAAAISSLRELSAERQMLYFSCHPVRTAGLE